MFIQSPTMISPSTTFLHLSNCMISTTPEIFNITQPNPFKGKTILQFIPPSNSSPNSVCLRLSSNKHPPSNEYSRMIAPRNNLSQLRLRIIPIIYLVYIIELRHLYWIHHFLSSQVFIVASKIYCPSCTTSKH